MNKPFSCLYFFLLIFQFGLSQPDLKAFYYPHDDCGNSNVYVYQSQDDPEDLLYWVVRVDRKCETIKISSYDSYFQRYNVVNEKITDSGTILTSYRDYEFNEYGEITRTWGSKDPRQAEVYKWNPKYPYSYRLIMNTYGYTIDLSKRREFKSIDTISFGNKRVKAARFYDYYLTRYYYKNKFDGDEQIIQYSWFVKGVGMIRYRRFNEDGIEEFELAEVIPMKEFNKRKSRFRMFGE